MQRKVQVISSAELPIPGGHYSHATALGQLVFISGQLPIGVDGHGSNMSFVDQTRQAVGNLLSVLRAAGGTAGDILKVTVYLVGIENWEEFNRIYAELMGQAKPARSVVPVPALHFGYLIEIDAVARRPGST
jgi:2-iminobutanoate/2-iminopropanoate deaminase